MIYRAHFPESIPYSQGEGRKSLARKLAQACRTVRPVMLPPRDEPHALTSGVRGNEYHLHSMFTWPDGRGVFAITRKYFPPHPHGEHPLYLPDPDRERVKLIVLPDQESFVMIALAGTSGTLYIAEVLYWYPEIPRIHPQFPFSLS